MTINNSKYKDRKVNLTGKMAILKDTSFNIKDLSNNLGLMYNDVLKIISINLSLDVKNEVFKFKKSPNVIYLEIGIKSFIQFLEISLYAFKTWNKSTLYILRYGTYRDMKYILSQIGNHGFNLGRGSSQKAHVFSPLEVRLSFYMMAMLGWNYKDNLNQNTFDALSKDLYLPFYDFKSRK